ncbi:hypothetical protein CLU83_1164 [Flavobacterium sp. 1]|uniref:hypothetical protein n=1 Tax=Flavobacterium sp. 1 TaxID=2035200 RepID=UPI000C24B75C|nr:hypothetical protein [Flavobacterium sp. 1]PJJ07941.1 hypothetical protein CLU83_1164 [Flavobacterium sp. 1]
MEDNTEIIKYFALLEELETSSKLIILGLGELQNLNAVNDFYFLPFQLLSQGFERFMKSYICIAYKNIHDKYPNHNYIKNLGHNLESLLKEILENYYVDFQRSQYKADIKFLKENDDLKELLFIISEFGKKSRYYNFDLITDNKNIPLNTKELWENFENKYLFEDEKLLNKLMDLEQNHEVFDKLNSIIIIAFEKFISALSRQFIFDCLGDKAKGMAVSSFYDFGRLYEKDFGNKDYRQITTRFKQTPKKIHKRTFIDDFNRKYNSKFKSLKIHKSDFTGEWPFYVDEVIVECREKHWCIVTIEGFDYALNGSAKGRYKLENPHDAGMAIIGKSTGDFIKIALEL